MTRSVSYGLVLVAVAAAAALWAVSSSDRPALQATAPVTQDEVTAEELERIWKEAEPAEPAEPAPEAAPAEQAASAAEDLSDRPAAADLTAPDEGATASAGEAVADPAAAQWAALAEAALSEPDDELRGEAVHAVGLQRNGEAVAVLVAVAADDPEPDNRYQALQSLWYSAADGLDEDGAIRRTLEAARDDPDEDIAELAERALKDLAKLEQAN